MFNSLKYAKQLEEAGVSREQAEVHMQIMTDIIESNLATKQDLKDLDSSLRQEISGLRSDILLFKESMDHRLKEFGQKIVIQLGSMMVVGIGVLYMMLKHV